MTLDGSSLGEIPTVLVRPYGVIVDMQAGHRAGPRGREDRRHGHCIHVPATAVSEPLDREACSADDRIVAAFLGGSRARGEADEYSDLDIRLVTRDDAFDDVMADRDALLRRLGEPLFIEDFGLSGIVFSILGDGTEVELVFGREGALDEINAGPFGTLLD
jgi:hypothetical protein